MLIDTSYPVAASRPSTTVLVPRLPDAVEPLVVSVAATGGATVTLSSPDSRAGAIGPACALAVPRQANARATGTAVLAGTTGSFGRRPS